MPETTERADMPLLLVVDDEPDMRRYLVTMLRESYRIIEAEDGISALEKAMTATPDLILLDVMLPGVSGLEVCRSLKEKPETRAIKIIVLTARADEEAKIIALKHGADDFLIKPFSGLEVRSRITKSHSRGATRARPAANQWRIETKPAATPRDGSGAGTKRQAKCSRDDGRRTAA